MKNYIKYFGILALGMVACEPEFENPVNEPGAYTSGEANFSTYVAVGNSMTAGYADGALYITGQQNSFPNILAQQFAIVGGGDFRQPLMADNTGGLLLNGSPYAGNRRVLAFDAEGNASPAVYGGTPTTEITEVLTGPFNNLGAPGAKSYQLLVPGFGNAAGVEAGMANPYFARFASSPETSIVADAVAMEPTFFSLWIGNNDVLGFATSGGVGVDQTGNMNPAEYDTNDITDPQVFAAAYSQILNQLTGTGADGVLFNIPDVTSLPYFTTIPNNALALDAATAAQLTGFFQAVAGIFTQHLISMQVPPAQAQAIASQYAITFNEGPNLFLIDVPVTQENPLGFRQMTADELLVLTIDQGALAEGYGSVELTPQVMEVLGILQAGGMPTAEQAQLVLGAVSGVNDGDVLDASEIEAIETATTAYNTTIENLATANNLAFVDVKAILKQVNETGVAFDGGMITSTFVIGGAFSLDGVHPTPRGQAFLANQAIEAINETYHASIPKVNIGNYATITPSNNVQ